MSIISVSHLTFGYETNAENVFNDVSFNLDTDWRLGLTARNGRGKTTLLRLLCNQMEYKGTIFANVKFDYFPFEISDENRLSIEIIEELVVDLELWELIKELNLLELDEECLYRPFSNLSGGEKTKLLLAALFLKHNSFLLIDEPTNHLDYHAREMLSNYLAQKKGFILVSHDRVFMDRCIDHVMSINRADIMVQRGNLSSYLVNKERQDKHEQAQNERLLGEIDRLKEAARNKADWSNKAEKEKKGNGPCDRGFLGHKAAKIMKASKVIEKRQNKAIEEKSSLLKNVEAAFDLKLIPLVSRGERIVEGKNISVNYGEKLALNEISFLIEEGQRIAVSGRNGSGKSTLLRVIAGLERGFNGELIKQGGIKISYVPQDTSHLKGSLKDYIAVNELDETLLKSILIKIDFSKSLFDRKLEELSQGQRKKVLLASSLSQSANLYIWDEPLNYIDLITRMQIEAVLLTYKPTLLFVEHDMSFSSSVSTSQIML